MRTLSNIWTFKTANFTISVDAMEDYDIDLSFDKTGEILEQLEAGQLAGFAVRVTVRDNITGEELASDYLGGCIYESHESFMNHRGIKKQPNAGSYFSDMVRTVCSEARTTIRERADRYSELLITVKA
jgi:hypothetical protein